MVVSILGAGWLGKALINTLQEKFIIVKASSRTYSKISELETLGANAFLIDYTKENGIIGDVTFFDCDCLVICLPPDRNNAGESNYVEVLKAYLYKALEQGVRKIIFTSSSGIYGEMEGVVDEDMDIISAHDNSFNGSKKYNEASVQLLEAENLFMSLENIDFYILRLAGLIGPGRQAGSFLAGKKNVANPNAPVNLVQQADVVSVICRFIENEYPKGVYNVCADEHPTRKEFYTNQALLLGLEVPEFLEDSNTKGRIASNEKVKRVLGFQFRSLG